MNTPNIELRPEVLAFARLMEQRLREKDAEKGSRWKDLTQDNLLVCATSAYYRMEDAIHCDQSTDIERAVDLANYCMMIADVAGALDAAPPKVEALTNNVERY
jgi:hypothetical protein